MPLIITDSRTTTADIDYLTYGKPSTSTCPLCTDGWYTNLVTGVWERCPNCNPGEMKVTCDDTEFVVELR